MYKRQFLTCAWVSMGLNGSTCSECLPVVTCNFESPEHVPRTSARATLAPWCSGGLPACPGAESTRKDPRPEKKKMLICQKKNTSIHSLVILFFGKSMMGVSRITDTSYALSYEACIICCRTICTLLCEVNVAVRDLQDENSVHPPRSLIY